MAADGRLNQRWFDDPIAELANFYGQARERNARAREYPEEATAEPFVTTVRSVAPEDMQSFVDLYESKRDAVNNATGVPDAHIRSVAELPEYRSEKRADHRRARAAASEALANDPTEAEQKDLMFVEEHRYRGGREQVIDKTYLPGSRRVRPAESASHIAEQGILVDEWFSAKKNVRVSNRFARGIARPLPWSVEQLGGQLNDPHALIKKEDVATQRELYGNTTYRNVNSFLLPRLASGAINLDDRNDPVVRTLRTYSIKQASSVPVRSIILENGRPCSVRCYYLDGGTYIDFIVDDESGAVVALLYVPTAPGGASVVDTKKKKKRSKRSKRSKAKRNKNNGQRQRRRKRRKKA